uniref:protein Decapping 5 n=1 Tax=Elaeis guineensis var. tenera TaxID=51953 RepID=A0A6J0PNW5_ELAGV|nr:protein decapping 5 [Elaeis guineensis]XP_010933006.1 protein decapping 5 [Elaeis guineensis]XP_019709085.1 protein decapping 5 [Elaeis guineensis]
MAAAEGSSTGSSQSSSSSSRAADSYIGSLISLTSKAEIRYEGVLVSINPQESTIALQNVRSYGTEGRKKDGPQIPPSDRVYEYILFRGSDIKDLLVKSSPVLTKPQAYNDPAIIQSCNAYAPSTSASVGGGALPGQGSHAAQSSLARSSYSDAFSLYQSGATLSSGASSPAFSNVNRTSFSTPMYWQGYAGVLDGQSPKQQLFHSQPPSGMVQDQLHLPESQAPTSMPNFTEPTHLTFTSAATSSHFAISTPSDVFLSVSSDPSQLSHPLSPLSYSRTKSSFSSSNQELNASMRSVSTKAGSSAIPVLPMPSLSYSSSSILGSTTSPLTTLPPLLTPDQFTQSRPTASSSNQRLTPEREDMAAVLPPSNPPSSVKPLPQEPLLPLQLSSQQGQGRMAQFTEEFDFTSMNEKFNKDEVWGSLGKAKLRSTIGNGMEENPIHDNVEVEEGYGQDPKLGRNPVYNKDNFFDNLSCNSLNRGSWSGRMKFSERMKLDTETFGEFQQGAHLGRGNHGPAHPGNFRGSYNRGRGYGYYYGGRGHGGYRPV